VRTCFAKGNLIACDVVWAEVAAAFDHHIRASEALEHLGVRFVALAPEMALAAGSAWRGYRRRAQAKP
jgi:hypothetical protein